MPTNQDIDNLNSKCDWNWATINGVNGYIVRGRGSYASNSIFLPCAGYGGGSINNGIFLCDAGSHGCYWSSVPIEDGSFHDMACALLFNLGSHDEDDFGIRLWGYPVRPVQGFTK
jgi:hypothetical protein